MKVLLKSALGLVIFLDVLTQNTIGAGLNEGPRGNAHLNLPVGDLGHTQLGEGLSFGGGGHMGGGLSLGGGTGHSSGIDIGGGAGYGGHLSLGGSSGHGLDIGGGSSFGGGLSIKGGAAKNEGAEMGGKGKGAGGIGGGLNLDGIKKASGAFEKGIEGAADVIKDAGKGASDSAHLNGASHGAREGTGEESKLHHQAGGGAGIEINRHQSGVDHKGTHGGIGHQNAKKHSNEHGDMGQAAHWEHGMDQHVNHKEGEWQHGIQHHIEDEDTGLGIDSEFGIGSRGGIKTPVMDLLKLSESVCKLSFVGERFIEDTGKVLMRMNRKAKEIDHAVVDSLVKVIVKAAHFTKRNQIRFVDFLIDTHINLVRFMVNTSIAVYRFTKAPIRELLSCH